MLLALKGSAHACFCASWVLPPQLTKFRLSAARAAWQVNVSRLAASTALARLENSIGTPSFLVF
ncbi:hypothetical protein D3C87_2167810 [compost metagenome]